MHVRDLMTRDVPTVPAGASLAAAVERMLDRRVGSAVVTRNGTPAGIVTESDALGAVVATDENLEAIHVWQIASRPLVTATPAQTVRSAVDRMIESNVKKLPVVDGYELVGIVTLTDVAWHFSDIRKEAQAFLEGRRDWEAEE